MLYEGNKGEAELQADQSALGELLTPTIFLLIVDCETHRFALMGPVPTDVSRKWIREIERAGRSGRFIICVPMPDAERSEIITLIGALGFQEWPASTIINPPSDVALEAELVTVSPPPVRGRLELRDNLRERELSTISRIGISKAATNQVRLAFGKKRGA